MKSFTMHARSRSIEVLPVIDSGEAKLVINSRDSKGVVTIYLFPLEALSFAAYFQAWALEALK